MALVRGVVEALGGGYRWLRTSLAALTSMSVQLFLQPDLDE